ncbi:MOSC domain-containing protein [Undibacter mobilis]|uniref:MOSC domain-containing protein n=1 Tax=Undibacter mobilis TaxID=2292256 RepID=A0A371B7C5_9BRAD|nr:MOSC domain-containing protein [Undibacter mobilis]RDV03515.1 MOSC domain-containing protein [Undibacter mobilis]
MSDQAIIQSIYRYPVKGLSPDRLPQVRLAAGAPLPADRLYAVENGPTGFDPAQPAYFPKTRFLMLMRNERLAGLKTAYDEASHTLTVVHEGREAVRADLRTGEGRLMVEAFFRKFMPAELNGPPKVLSGEGAPDGPHSFSDVAKKVVSIINLASVAAIETAIGQPVDPLRFRGNLYVTGWPAWREFDLLNHEIEVGSPVRLKVIKRIVRCAATNVDPTTGARDLNIPKTLMQTFNHMDCGIYAEVIEGGDIAEGDALKVNALL